MDIKKKIEMMDSADRVLVEHIDSAVKQLAMERAVLLSFGILTEEEVTELITVSGEKWYQHYEGMNPVDIMFEGLMEMAEAKAKREMEDK